MTTRRLVALLLAVLVALPAAAQAGWSDPGVLASGDVALSALAADSRGGLLATWSAADTGAFSQALGSGGFGPVESFPAASPVAAAADFHGAVHLTWRAADGIRYARRAADGSLDHRALLGETTFRARPVIAADPAGDVAVAWRDYTGGRWFIRLAIRRADGDFGPPAQLGSGTAASDPAVAVTTGGEVVVAWFQNGSPRRMMGAVGTLDGAVGDPVELAAPGSVVAVQVLAHPGGAATVAWHGFGADSSFVAAVRHPEGGAFGDPATVAGGGITDADAINGFSAAVTPGGWLLAYRRGRGVYAREVSGVDPGPARPLEEQGADQLYHAAAAVATDPQTGRGVIAWSGRDRRVHARRILADGGWGDEETLSPAGGEVDEVRAAMGDQPAVAWHRAATDAAPAAIGIARYVAPSDPTPPPPPPPPAADRTPPRLTVTLAPRIATARLVHLRVRCSEPCRLRLTGRLTHTGRRVAALTARRRIAGRRTVALTLVLPPSARRALAAHRTLRLVLTVRAADAAGNARTVVRSARLR